MKISMKGVMESVTKMNKTLELKFDETKQENVMEIESTNEEGNKRSSTRNIPKQFLYNRREGHQ